MSDNIGECLKGMIRSTENIRKMSDKVTDHYTKEFIREIVGDIETYNCIAMETIETKIRLEIAEYNEDSDIEVTVGTHHLTIKIPDYIKWDAEDLLTIELYFGCTFVESTRLTDYMQYEFEWK